MKINFITYGDIEGKRGSTRIRVLNVMKALEKRGWKCAFNDESIAEYDILFFQKTTLKKEIKDILTEARRLEIPIVLDLDDYTEDLIEELKYFDLITVSTDYLKEVCSKYHPNVVVIPNMLDVNDVDIALKSKNKHKEIVWYGYSQNSYILDKWMIQGVKKISDKDCDVIYNAEKIDEQLQKFDLVIIPQEQTKETLVKTHCRMLKALYLGLPCLVSDLPVYVELAKELNFPEDFIVYNPKEWNEKISAYKSGKLKFDFDFAAAREKIMAKYGAEATADIFQQKINNFMATKHKPLVPIPEKNGQVSVSVILTDTKNKNRILQSIKSIQNQTLFDWEIIIADSSPAEEIAELAQKDGRIRLNQQPRGQYVYFLTSGSIIETSCLKRLYSIACMSDADITMMQNITVNEHEKTLIPAEKCAKLITNMGDVLEFLDYPLILGTCLYRSDFLLDNGIWAPELQILPDLDFAYLVWKKCQSLYVIPENLLHTQSTDLKQEKIVSGLLKQYAEKVLPAENNIVLLIHSTAEIVQALITLTSIAEKTTTKLKAHVFFMFNITAQFREIFEELENKYLSIELNEIAKDKTAGNRLNMLIYILLNWQKSKRVLYVSHSCLALNDFSEIFTYETEKAICSRMNEIFVDMNVMLLDVAKIKEKFANYPLKKKISDNMWFSMMYQDNEDLSANFDYYAEEYRSLTPELLSKIKILCYKNQKPWEDLTIPFVFLWWKYARKSAFYENLLLRKPASVENFSFAFSDKLSTLKLVQQTSGDMYPLMKAYVKEALFSLFTFGNAAKVHKANLGILAEKIREEATK